jgi:hypothetical protein
MKAPITQADFQAAADALGVPVAAVRAVTEIEAPGGGFDKADQPRILFEGHIFHKLTGGRFSAEHPNISYAKWANHYAKGKDADARNAGEHQRLAEAAGLARAAALMSASWGRFQILGENYAMAGFATLQDFINAMYESEAKQLQAFVEFVQHDRGGKGWKALKAAVATGVWTPFAEFYNGAAQAEHQYDKRLAAAFKLLS